MSCLPLPDGHDQDLPAFAGRGTQRLIGTVTLVRFLPVLVWAGWAALAPVARPLRSRDRVQLLFDQAIVTVQGLSAQFDSVDRILRQTKRL